MNRDQGIHALALPSNARLPADSLLCCTGLSMSYSWVGGGGEPRRILAEPFSMHGHRNGGILSYINLLYSTIVCVVCGVRNGCG
ncbi:hypothetical protein BJX76DRAFT_315379 [Aspergillus varians]